MKLFGLIKKNREYDESAFQRARRQLIEESVNNPRGYPTVGAETAILRKQINAILEALFENGIDAGTEEFQVYNKFVEEQKAQIDKALANPPQNTIQ